MAAAYKLEIRWQQLMVQRGTEPSEEDVMVSLVADLQQEQDKESETLLTQLQDKVRWTPAVESKNRQCPKTGIVL